MQKTGMHVANDRLSTENTAAPVKPRESGRRGRDHTERGGGKNRTRSKSPPPKKRDGVDRKEVPQLDPKQAKIMALKKAKALRSKTLPRPPKGAAPPPPGARYKRISESLMHASGAENWGKWYSPKAKHFKVRDCGYAEKKEKKPSKPFLFPLTHCEMLNVDPGPLDHVCEHKNSWWQKYVKSKEYKELDKPFALVFNLQVTSVGVSVIHYHVLPGGLKKLEKKCPRVWKMLTEVIETQDKQEIDTRFKFIPRVVEGPYVVQVAVRDTPVILGTKIEQKYFKNDNYLEIDCQVDSSYAAAAIIRLAHTYSVNIVCDMVWCLEGQKEYELPERLLAGVTLSYVDFAKVEGKPIETAPPEGKESEEDVPKSYSAATLSALGLW